MGVDVVFEDAWRRSDPRHAADARAFWRDMLPPDERNRRIHELCCMAYEGDRLVGLSTAYPAVVPQMKARVLAYRCAVDPAFRRHELAKQITARSLAILEPWSAQNPDEGIAGMIAVIEAGELQDMALRPTWREYDLNLNLAFYTPTGQQLRVAWFPHAKLEPQPASASRT